MTMPSLFQVLQRPEACGPVGRTRQPNRTTVQSATYATLRLAWLASDIVEAIVNGRQPPRLTATELFRLSGHLPLGRPQQRTLIGFTNNKMTGA